jgi:hypothetical protein
LEDLPDLKHFDASIIPAELPPVGRLTRLTSLRLNINPRDMAGPMPASVSLGTGLEALAPLQAIRRLCLGGIGLRHPAECAPLAALSALTSLTLPLTRWDEPLGKLPPNLKTLELSHLPEVVPVDLPPPPLPPPPHLPVSLSYPLLKPALGTAATSLRCLTVALNLHYVRTLVMNLARYSAPCAFPHLTEFHVRISGAGTHGANTADLVALLEAAPRLGYIWLEDFKHLSSKTLHCLRDQTSDFLVKYREPEGNYNLRGGCEIKLS